MVERFVSFFVTSVDDHIEVVFFGEFEMLAKEISLSLVIVFGGPAVRCGVKVVESGFADGGYFGVREVRGDEGFEVVAGVVDVAGVDAEAGVDFGMVGGELEVWELIGFVGGECDEAVDPGIEGVLKNCRDLVWGEFMGGEVAMGVGEHGGSLLFG